MHFAVIPYSAGDKTNPEKYSLALVEYDELESVPENPWSPGKGWTDGFYKVKVKVKRVLAYTGVHDPATHISYIRDGIMQYYILSQVLNDFLLETDSDDNAMLWWEMLDKRTN